MKTPITYYGGKQNMADIIVPLLPLHRLYCEPFTGGAAIFFAKHPSTEEVLNDLNEEVVNFWEVLKTDYDGLADAVNVSLHSRELHRQAGVVYANTDMFDRVKRAWAVWYLTSAGFGSMIDGTWGNDLQGKRALALKNKRDNFLPCLSERLAHVRIENCDACKVIKDNDAPDSLFYTDPPYVGADQGHYAGYTQEMFDALLETLADIKGKFLLSSYPNENLVKFTGKCGWHTVEVKMNNSMSAAERGHGMEKTEVLTANYPISGDGLEARLFD
jgi:DNA adenine methylase